MRLDQTAGLAGFLARVERSVDDAILAGRFDVTQRDLLLASAAQHRPRARHNPLADPLAVFYLIARAHREELDEQAVELATFCTFYLLALDLLDDVQDEDLAGKPHADVGAGMAVNDALTLLFLGLSALERTMRLERSPLRRMLYLKIVNRVALTTGRGQHLDLLGLQGARTPEEVLHMQREKTASLALLCECAALYAGVSDEEREHYRQIGENLSMLVQVLDDLRDLFGKARSPDLETGKMTYPVACFLECASAEDLRRFHDLTTHLPGSLAELRQLLYDNGAARRSAQAMDRFRRRIHEEVASFSEDAATHRMLLGVVDQLVRGVYAPKPVVETAALCAPRFGWHGHVQRLVRDFATRLAPWGAPPPPPFVPWHQPHWAYDRKRGVIHYPDVEGLPEETLPFHSRLLDEPDLERVAKLMWRQAPALVAHELFHHYRDTLGQLSEDRWHEELIANTLAIAYCARFEPDAVQGSAAIAEGLQCLPGRALSAAAEGVLARLASNSAKSAPSPTVYGLDARQSALLQLCMISELCRSPEPLERAMERWLGARIAAA